MFDTFETPVEGRMDFGPRRGPFGGPFGGPWGGPGFRRGPFFWHIARRWGFGPGRGFGPGGPRMFGRGDLKFALLDLLQERPKHGYEMMKELEQRAGGFYMPSAGAIYPTLQMLEDRGWVTVEMAEGKKVYAITDDGRAALKQRHEQPGDRPFGGPRGPWGWGPDFEHGPEGGPGHGPGHHEHWREHGRHGRGPWGREAVPELRELMREGRDVAHLMRTAVMMTGGNPERLAQLRAIVTRARTDLEAFIHQGQPTPPTGETPPTPTSSSGPVEQV